MYEGAIDLQFTNTFNTPVRIETDFGGGKITVRLKGTKTVDVESVNNGRWAKTDPQPMSVPAATARLPLVRQALRRPIPASSRT